MATHFPESRVLIIMTGGTICMRSSPEGLVPARGFLKEGMAPRPSFNDGSNPDPLPVMTDALTKELLPSLRTPPSTYSRHIRYTLYEFPILLDSSSISSAGWTQIATSILNNYSLFDGFVVLHGTDSLAYTSSALSFMFSHLGKPVILTGSQASIFALQSDAVDNLLGSLIIAGTFKIPEVCLFFHHRLLRGNRATKVSASSFDAFASPNSEPLATVTAMGANVNWHLVRRSKAIARFDIQVDLDTAHVACLRIFPGIKASMIDGVLRIPNLRGLILETFGAGNAPNNDTESNSLTSVIKAAVERGIVIVNVSQCQSGSVSPLYAPATVLGRAGVVFGHDLTTEAALTKLSFLLALPELTYTDIVTQMSISLRGEMTELTTPQFAPSTEEPSISLTQTAFTALGHAITSGDIDSVTSLLDSNPDLLQASDYASNTALHLAAVGPDTRVMRELLKRGASVHERNRAGNTPLFLARQVGNKDGVRLLINAGAMLHAEEREAGASTPPVSGRGSPSLNGGLKRARVDGEGL